MRISYAVSTMIFWWREHHLSFEQECDYLRSLGYGVELWPTIKSHADCRFDHRNWPRLKEATKNMFVALKSRIDGPTLEEWAEQIECAKTLSAPIVADLPSLCISDKLGIADWGFAAEVIKTAQASGVKLHIETGNLHSLLQVGEKFDYINYCLDTGFANIDPNNSFTDYIDQLAERTTYLHLCDNYGKIDDHEPAGLRGGMPRKNWDYLLNALNKYDNHITGSFEMNPCMPGTMILQGSKFLFDVIGWPNKPKPKADSDITSYRPI